MINIISRYRKRGIGKFTKHLENLIYLKTFKIYLPIAIT